MSMNISPATHKEILRRVDKYLKRRSAWNIPITNEEFLDIVEDALDEVQYLPKKTKAVPTGHSVELVHIPLYGKFTEMRVPTYKDVEIDEFYEHDVK